MLMMVDVTPSAPERHTEMTDEQKDTIATVQGERTFPNFNAMLDQLVLRQRHRRRRVRAYRTRFPRGAHRRELRTLGAERAAARSSTSCAVCVAAECRHRAADCDFLRFLPRK